MSALNFLYVLAASDAGIIKYFNDSNFAGQVIVVVLIAFSIVAWAALFGKYNDLKNMRALNASVENRIARSPSIVEAVAQGGLRGPYAALVKEAVAAWNRSGGDPSSIGELTLKMQQIENAIQRALSRQYIRYESKMVLLGSIISGAPFLGLLGTVWGVMDSFGSMSGQGTVTLQQLAPGVSGALLTTIVGLLVALPSLFGYNFLLTRSKGMVTDLENFASSLCDKFELEARQRMAYAQPNPRKSEVAQEVYGGVSEYVQTHASSVERQIAGGNAIQGQASANVGGVAPLPGMETSGMTPQESAQRNIPQPQQSFARPERPSPSDKFKISFDDEDDGGRY